MDTSKVSEIYLVRKLDHFFAYYHMRMERAVIKKNKETELLELKERFYQELANNNVENVLDILFAIQACINDDTHYDYRVRNEKKKDADRRRGDSQKGKYKSSDSTDSLINKYSMKMDELLAEGIAFEDAHEKAKGSLYLKPNTAIKYKGKYIARRDTCFPA